MQIRDFGVEIWMNSYENHCKYNIAETCVHSLGVSDVLALANDPLRAKDDLLSLHLTYGAIEGRAQLREQIASLFQKATPENVVTTHGAIGANHLALETLVEPGDHVISVLPTYQQHYSIPESLGAEVSILRLRPENNWLPDLEELRALMRPTTKVVCINNPNNPSGSLMDEAYLQSIVEIVRPFGAYILCDEVYRGLNHVGDYFSASIFDLYELGISTGSMSKTFSLAGLRLGWITGPSAFIEHIMKHRDYNTISCGVMDEYLAEIALTHREKILDRNRKLLQTNIALLDDWMHHQPHLQYIKPVAGTTAFVHFDYDLSSTEFCERLLKEQGVLLVPGAALDVEEYLRFGYANETGILRSALEALNVFLRSLKNFPLRSY